MDKSIAVTMRHEEKYICSEKQMYLLENRLKYLLPKDENQTDDFYNIRSLYFDTVNDRMWYESLQGIEKRNKFRLRIYDQSADIIKLEKKTSLRNLKTKSSVLVDRNLSEKMIYGENIDFSESYGLLDEFSFLQKTEGLFPKVIVEYERTAFVYDIGNVRITFDKNIRASTETEEFYSPFLLCTNVQSKGQGVLEIKYDGILPGYIANVLNTGNLQKISFSKYALCRNVIENNGRLDEYYEL